LHVELVFGFPALPLTQVVFAALQPVRKIVKDESGLWGRKRQSRRRDRVERKRPRDGPQ
jgi:hypothetical protein